MADAPAEPRPLPDAVARAREASRRHAAVQWDRLPAHLGIHVEQGQVPASLPDAAHPNAFVDVLPDQALARLVGGNRVLVSHGKRATVHVPDDVRGTGDSGWLVQGWTVALAMAQRGLLTLHGSSVEVDGEALCIAGPSGAGKSTTALGLATLGHRLLVDDVTIVEWDSTGRPVVVPYLRGVHLTRLAAERLGLDFTSLPQLSAGRGKATYVAEDPGSTPVPLTRIVVLGKAHDTDTPVARNLTGAARLQALATVASREEVAPAVMGPHAYFGLLTRLAAAVAVTSVTRPIGHWTLDDLLRVVVPDGPAESPSGRVLD